MIFTDRTIIVQKGVSSINDTIVLYRGDKDVEIRFTLNEGSPFKFSNRTSPNIIEKTEASYGQLIIKTPNDLPTIFSEVAPTNEGKIVFKITGKMIDEIVEVGYYTFQIRLFDENRNSRATLPEVVNGIEIREPIAAEVTDTNEAGIATVGYALTTAGTPEDTFDSQGNYNKTTWATGNRITASKLNKIEAGIDGVNRKVSNAEGALQEVGSQIKEIENNILELNPSISEELCPKTYIDDTPVSIIKDVSNLQYKLFNIILDPINGRLYADIKISTSTDGVNFTQLKDVINVRLDVVNEKQNIYIRIDDLYKYLKIEVENLRPGNPNGYYSSFNATINMIGR